MSLSVNECGPDSVCEEECEDVKDFMVQECV